MSSDTFTMREMSIIIIWPRECRADRDKQNEHLNHTYEKYTAATKYFLNQLLLVKWDYDAELIIKVLKAHCQTSLTPEMLRPIYSLCKDSRAAASVFSRMMNESHTAHLTL